MITDGNAVGTRRSLFNMIEVALAIAVVAIGLSSIMVLFPVGLNATSAAITDDNIPDAAEYILSYMEGRILKSWRHDGGAKKSDFLDLVKDKKPDDSRIQEESKKITAGEIDKEQVNDDGILLGAGNIGLFRFQKVVKLESSAGGERTDFAVDALVWRESVRGKSFETLLAVPGITGSRTKEKTVSDKAAVELCVELSWPIEQQYVMREKRLYRLTLVNPAAAPEDFEKKSGSSPES